MCQINGRSQDNSDSMFWPSKLHLVGNSHRILLSCLHHSENIAHDPYARVHFFHFIITTMLENLFSVHMGSQWVCVNRGVLGHVQAYISIIESQNWATLHLHMLLWMENTPSSEEIKELFKYGDFWSKIQTYLAHNIQAHFPGIGRDSLKDIPCEADLAWSRPLDPHSPTFDNDYTDLEGRLMQSNQIHMCHVGACLLYNGWSAIMKCKRCAPWPLSAENSVDERGNWVVKCTYSYVNNYQPDLLVMLWCNHDIKLLTNGEDTKNLTWYIWITQQKARKAFTTCLHWLPNTQHINSQTVKMLQTAGNVHKISCSIACRQQIRKWNSQVHK